MSGRPFARTRLASYLQRRILELKPRKKQSTIAFDAGFVNPNMLAMIKYGRSKLPLDRVLGLAKALECDPKMLFVMAIEQLGDGDTTQVAVQQIFGTVVTDNEVAWLEEIRRASDHTDPTLTARARSAIRGIFGK